MAKTQKKAGRGSQKCKTARVTRPYRQSWCVAFLAYALKTANVEAACRTCEVEIGEYLMARRTDPAFELACQELDLIVRAAAVATLEAAAARGEANVGKLKLLLQGIEQLRVFPGDGPESSETVAGLPSWIFEEVERWREHKRANPDFEPERYTLAAFCHNSEFERMQSYYLSTIETLRSMVQEIERCPKCDAYVSRTCKKCGTTNYEMRQLLEPDSEQGEAN
jgi:hypothetical protein